MVAHFAAGHIPRTAEISAPPECVGNEGHWLWLEHEPLSFPCYPHEITALQLYDSAKLTLDIAIEAVRHGWILKDASAWNVLHDRGRPIFVDLLSFDRDASKKSWIAYGQFNRHFLLPLLLYQKLGITPPEIFLTNRDGITPEHAYRMLSAPSLLSGMALELIVLPKMLAGSGTRLIESEIQKSDNGARKATYAGRHVVLDTLSRLRRFVERLRPTLNRSRSVWKEYEEQRAHYTDEDLAAKAEFVRQNLGDCGTVLDLGCNAGEFSLIASEAGKQVVAADFDHPALSTLYARIQERHSPVMPLMLNVGRPTPAVGWANTEIPSFIDRAIGRFDCVLMLGLIHHLLVTERVSIPMLVDFLVQLRPRTLILEWIEPQDEKFRQLAGLNGALYSGLNSAVFEDELRQHFRLVAKLQLPCATRIMYLWQT